MHTSECKLSVQEELIITCVMHFIIVTVIQFRFGADITCLTVFRIAGIIAYEGT